MQKRQIIKNSICDTERELAINIIVIPLKISKINTKTPNLLETTLNTFVVPAC